MSLDTISQVLKAECCWIQTTNSGKGPLSLVAHRGLSPEMEAEIAAMAIDHDFSEVVIGTGQKIVIPDLSHDGKYGLSSFGSAGYRWLIAVPLLTYRVFGLMGVASRYKKHFQKETPELARVIGGLIASALNKAELSHKSLDNQKVIGASKHENKTEKLPPENKAPKLPDAAKTFPVPTVIEADRPPSGNKSTKLPDPAETSPVSIAIEADRLPSEKKSTKSPDPTKMSPGPTSNVHTVLNDSFHHHTQKMERFRRSHRK
jgi:hypothetical protein